MTDWNNCPSNTSFLEDPTDPENRELSETETAEDQLRKALEQAYTTDKLSKQTQFNAVCLRKLKDAADVGIIKVKARIPELHSLLPLPKSENDVSTMSLYPTFIALKESFKTRTGDSAASIPAGTVLVVTFGNMSNFGQPRLLEIGNIAGSGARAAPGSGGSGGSGTGRGGAGAGAGAISKIGKFSATAADTFKFEKKLAAAGNPYTDIKKNSKNYSISPVIQKNWENAAKQIHELGGYVFLSGFRRGFNSKITPYRAIASWHYVACAVDFNISLAMGRKKVPLEKQPYIAVRDGKRHWTIWAKAMDSSAPQYASVSEIELDAWEWKKGTGGTAKRVRGKYFNLTEIMENNGFSRIGAKRNWKNKYLGTEWWHFQDTKSVPEGTSWRDLILAISTEEKIIKSKYGQKPTVAGHTNEKLVKSGLSPWELTKDWKLKGENFGK